MWREFNSVYRRMARGQDSLPHLTINMLIFSFSKLTFIIKSIFASDTSILTVFFILHATRTLKFSREALLEPRPFESAVLWPRPPADLLIKWWSAEVWLTRVLCFGFYRCDDKSGGVFDRRRAWLIDWQEVIRMRGSAYVPVSAAVALFVSSSTLFFTFTWVIIHLWCHIDVQQLQTHEVLKEDFNLNMSVFSITESLL